MQAIIFHELIGKRKDAIDHLCRGLEPTVFEPVFMYMEEQESIISVFEIDESILDEQKQNIYE